MTKRILRTLEQFSNEDGTFSVLALRHLRFYSSPGPSSRGYREGNGFATAFRKIGRSLYIDVNEFYRCVDRINGVTPEE